MSKKRRKKSNKKFLNFKNKPKLIISVFGIIIGLTLGLNIKVLGKVFKVDTKYINVLNDTIKEKIENTSKNITEKENSIKTNEIKDNINEKIKYKVINVID